MSRLHFFLFFLIAFSGPLAAQEAAIFTQEQETRIKDIVENLLRDKPDMIMESIQAYQKKKQEEDQKARAESLGDITEKLASEKDLPIAGDKYSKLVVVEFFDFNCGYCRRMAQTISKVLETEKDVRFIFVDLPILGPTSLTAAQASLAAYQQNPAKYMEYHMAVLSARGAITEDLLLKKAEEVGLNLDRLKKDMKSQSVKKRLDQNRAYAEKLMVRGTPAMIIGNTFIGGAIDVEDLKKRIAETRQQLADTDS